MKVLVVGATGHIGGRLFRRLESSDWCEVYGTSRSRAATDRRERFLQVDSRQRDQLQKALQGVDCVVNCVAGDHDSIAEGSRTLVDAAMSVGCARIVHLSTMAVYGRTEGDLGEDAPFDPGLGWYASAKCEAEAQMKRFTAAGGQSIILRPGCVYGPGSQLWVGRIARWLIARRLGDLGTSGDGWSNLVHIEDVCNAVIAALRLAARQGQHAAYNLAAPDSPRWNRYFTDLAISLGATPVHRITRRRLKLDAFVAGPPLKIAEKLGRRLGSRVVDLLPEPLTPNLVSLWAQQIHLDARLASQELQLTWTPYDVGLHDSVEWFLAR